MKCIVFCLIWVLSLSCGALSSSGDKVTLHAFEFKNSTKDDVFNFNFSYLMKNYLSYNIENLTHCGSNNNYYCESLKTTNFSLDNLPTLTGLFAYGHKGIKKYCIQITQISPDNSSELTKFETFDIPNDPAKIPCDKNISCSSWNISIAAVRNIQKESSSIFLKLRNPEFGSCLFPTVNFTVFISNSDDGELNVVVQHQILRVVKIIIRLYKVVDWSFDENELCMKGNLVDSRNETFSPQSAPDFEFPNLKPGNYCFVLTPRFLDCSIKPLSLHSNIIELRFHEHFSHDENESFWEMLGILIGCIIVLIFLFVALFVYIHKLRNFRPEPLLPYEIKETKALIPNVYGPHRKVLTVLYSQETEEISDCIIALVRFLRVSCNLVIRLDIENDASVRSNPNGWYSQGDLFILFETGASVFRERAHVENRKTFHINEDLLDAFFLFSLNQVIHDPNSIGDFSKYVVVRFPFTPMKLQFRTIAINKRYIISQHQHLAHLCHFLKYGRDLVPGFENIKNFEREWEHTKEYEALNRAIAQASKFVKENPNYVEDVIKYRNPDR